MNELDRKIIGTFRGYEYKCPGCKAYTPFEPMENMFASQCTECGFQVDHIGRSARVLPGRKAKSKPTRKVIIHDWTEYADLTELKMTNAKKNAKKLEALVRKARTIPGEYTDKFKALEKITVSNAVLDYCFYALETNLWHFIIFNHDFARALFGDVKIEVYGGLWTKDMPKPTTIELHQVDAYLHHLQQAVISEDPIGYMYNEAIGDA